MTNMSPAGLPDGLPGAQDEPEPDSPSKERHFPSASFGIDILCDDTRWQPYLVLIEASLGVLAENLGLPEHGEVSVKLTDDRKISELNSGFRDKSGATNVLSFPALDFTAPSEKNDFPQMPFSLGDIVLAFDTLAFEADAAEKDFADHLVHLLVHLSALWSAQACRRSSRSQSSSLTPHRTSRRANCTSDLQGTDPADRALACTRRSQQRRLSASRSASEWVQRSAR